MFIGQNNIPTASNFVKAFQDFKWGFSDILTDLLLLLFLNEVYYNGQLKLSV